MSTGKDWSTNKPIQPVPAVWIGEERRDDIKAEFSCFEELQMNQDLVRVGSVADVHEVADLHDVIRSIRTKIVVIDPVADLVNVRTGGSTYRAMKRAILDLCPPEPDVAVIGMLHSGRRSTDSVSSYIGSAGQGGACDLLLVYAFTHRERNVQQPAQPHRPDTERRADVLHRRRRVGQELAGRRALIDTLRCRPAGSGRGGEVVVVDQRPVGRSSRSNPATYVGMFDAIRRAFATRQPGVARALQLQRQGFLPGMQTSGLPGGRAVVPRRRAPGLQGL